ncbi:hypothetical protein [Streptomyces sp. NPDC127197]|uniref:hypothetical protein n=1 Tax=Streptomyces sp. NPDC127197 TaxID=3345388 RepID=UPI003630AD6C
MDLDAVADELYGLRPEDFVAARDARAAAARKAGDRALAEKIAGLRRPSLSAWASNLLVREQPGEVEPLLQLGEGLRRAHQELDGAQLRELSRRQRVLISALSRQAGHLAAEHGRPIGEGAQREIESTLHAVLADPKAAEEWASGRLVKPLTAAVGFPVADQGAVRRAAALSPAPEPPPAARRERAGADERRRSRLVQARQEAEAAERELRAAEKDAAAADHEANEATSQADHARQRVSELAEELERAEEEHRQARAAERRAHERVRFAERRVREAGRRAEAAAGQVERLTPRHR